MIKPLTYARTVYSPSQISMAHTCFRQWLWRYVLGIKREGPAQRGRAFGVLIHNCLAVYLGGGRVTDASLDTLTESDRRTVDEWYNATAAVKGDAVAKNELERLLREAPQRALSGLHLLPDAATVNQRLVEIPLLLDTTSMHRFRTRIEFSDWSRMDLVVQRVDGGWYVYDHKSTAGDANDPWAYVPSEDTLKRDVQFLLYCASVMQQNGLSEIWGRWVYYYSGFRFAPQARAVDVKITWLECVHLLQPYFETVNRMTTEIRRVHNIKRLPVVNSYPLPENVLTIERQCDKFRGCPYRDDECKPPKIPLDVIAEHSRKKKEDTIMGLDDRVNQMQVAGYTAPPTVAQPQVVSPPGYIPPGYIPPGYTPVLGPDGAIVGYQPIPQQTAAPTPAPQAPAVPSGDPVAGLAPAMPGTPAPQPAPVVVDAAPTEEKKRGRKSATTAKVGDDTIDAACAILGLRAQEINGVIAVTITFDGTAS